MTSCLVLSDPEIHTLLINQTRQETQVFLDKVAQSLIQVSSAGEEKPYQPLPAVINRADGRKNLFRTFTSPTGVGVKIIVDPSAALTSQSSDSPLAERNRLKGLHGIIALCDENGFPSGFLNAEEITGYRTTLSALILWTRRAETGNVVIFGAGKQALWHTRLMLALRGEDVKRISYVNRSVERTEALVEQVRRENEERWKADVEFNVVEAGDKGALKSILGEADAVFCTTPSTEVLFPADFVTRKKECYISAIGSWQAGMIELDPELLRFAAGKERKEGIVVVDDLEECLKKTGEGVQSGLTDEQISGVGEVLHLLKDEKHEHFKETKQCLQSGFVVYKSVGVSITDLAAGQAVLALAKEKGTGISIPEF